ncbi:DNA protecting protein DprA [Candidatus Termititenax dinenymphae]|uniref:DNA protecting protein DprA n=1 Tax=Candidatus Termititenax dinenymphae TaxID=2218523 RepID=A0A388TKT9_9BACT|nr:DNA protecting protein DprA [Candidatus Termititenax dinenymphae]
MSSTKGQIMSVLLGFSLFSDFSFVRLQFLLRRYAPEQCWSSFTAQDLRQMRFSPQRSAEILETRNKFDPEKFQEKLTADGITTIDYFEPEYPALLKEIFDPPLVLYKKGVLNLQNCSGIAVVGTRYPTDYGRTAAAQIIRTLNIGPLISGMARGIDTIAHQTALDLGLPTIAVLGTGVEQCYPAENKNIYARLSKEGALLSEYPPGSHPDKWRFPRRNRIITGLSKATLVIEGMLTSGALISGKAALEQNRDVYALPGRLGEPAAEGTNWLIAQGAKPIYNLERLTQELGGQQELHFAKPTYTLTDDESKIYNEIPAEGAVSMDALLEKFDVSFLSKTLLQMEIKGIISILPGKKILRI